MSYFNSFEDNNICLNQKKIAYEILVSIKNNKKKHLDNFHNKIKIVDSLLLIANSLSIVLVIIAIEYSLS